MLCVQDAEKLNAFYKMCVVDNIVIMDIAVQDSVRIPAMPITALNNIIEIYCSYVNAKIRPKYLF